MVCIVARSTTLRVELGCVAGGVGSGAAGIEGPAPKVRDGRETGVLVLDLRGLAGGDCVMILCERA